MCPIHVESVYRFSPRRLIGCEQWPSFPLIEGVAERMLFIFTNTIQVVGRQSNWQLKSSSFNCIVVKLHNTWINWSEKIRPGNEVSKITVPVLFLVIFNENTGSSNISMSYCDPSVMSKSIWKYFSFCKTILPEGGKIWSGGWKRSSPSGSTFILT